MISIALLIGLSGIVLISLILGSVALGMRNSKTTGQTLASPVLLHPVAGNLGNAPPTVTAGTNVTSTSVSPGSNDTSGSVLGFIAAGGLAPVGDFDLIVKFGTPYPANATNLPRAVTLTNISGVPIDYLAVGSLDRTGFTVNGHATDPMTGASPLFYYHVL